MENFLGVSFGIKTILPVEIIFLLIEKFVGGLSPDNIDVMLEAEKVYFPE